jgi:hypothetical protein
MSDTVEIAEDDPAASAVVEMREEKTDGPEISDLAMKGVVASPISRSATEEFLGFHPLVPRGVVVNSELVEQIRDQEGVKQPSSFLESF